MKTYKYLFGPVPSRRLGISLGIDLVKNKECSLNCIYCEVGRTRSLTTKVDEYVIFEEIEDELIDYFSSQPDPDYITISGAGEPTLNVNLGRICAFIKYLKPHVSIALLTNGTLLSDPNVQANLKNIDLLLPSLDAAFEPTFLKINRPARQVKFNNYIKGLTNLKNIYSGNIWLEIFIIPGLNDSLLELVEFKKIIQQINPDKVQLNTLDRPGVIANLKPAKTTRLKDIIDYWKLPNVEIISKKTLNPRRIAPKGSLLGEHILQTIERRPCTIEDLESIFMLPRPRILKQITLLKNRKQITTQNLERGTFYMIAE